MDLSVIIVSYNVKYFLEHCLLSVQKACTGIAAEILVVDNASADGSREYLETKFAGVRFFWSKENAGFAKANNAMLQKAKGKYILFLNPDTIVPEDCFLKSIDFFKTHPDCGALGVKMVDGSGTFLPESKRTLPNARSGFYKMTGLAELFPGSKKLAGYYAHDVGENESGKADILAGAFMMLTKEATEQTKGFDEDFFMYGEDIDLSYRVMKAGFKNYYCGEITIIHFKGESTQKQSPDHLRHFYGAMKRFADKHYKRNMLRDIAINLGKTAAMIKIKFYREKKNDITSTDTILIRGDASEKIQQTLLQNKYRIISAAEQHAGAVLFCEGTLSNKAIIKEAENLSENTIALFHEEGAESIIASADKNKRGLAIAMN